MHRDIKPANIFLHHGACKLGDLGLSKEVQSLTVPLKHTQCGSPLYLSPEVHMGLPYSKTVDLWALGSTLFEMMVLEHAFQGRNDAEVLGNVVWARYAEIKGNWSPHLVIMLKAMLSLNPADRPVTSHLLAHSYFSQMIHSGELSPKALRHRYTEEGRECLKSDLRRMSNAMAELDKRASCEAHPTLANDAPGCGQEVGLHRTPEKHAGEKRRDEAPRIPVPKRRTTGATQTMAAATMVVKGEPVAAAAAPAEEPPRKAPVSHAWTRLSDTWHALRHSLEACLRQTEQCQPDSVPDSRREGVVAWDSHRP